MNRPWKSIAFAVAFCSLVVSAAEISQLDRELQEWAKRNFPIRMAYYHCEIAQRNFTIHALAAFVNSLHISDDSIRTDFLAFIQSQINQSLAPAKSKSELRRLVLEWPESNTKRIMLDALDAEEPPWDVLRSLFTYADSGNAPEFRRLFLSEPIADKYGLEARNATLLKAKFQQLDTLLIDRMWILTNKPPITIGVRIKRSFVASPPKADVEFWKFILTNHVWRVLDYDVQAEQEIAH